MANRTALFLDTTTGSLKGISSTLDNATLAGVQSGAATNLTLQRTSTGAATVTLNAASVALGADLTALTVAPTAGTFALANTGATTLNIGGAATTVSLGASTGTTTINNASTVVTGDLTINGGDLIGAAGSFNLLNSAVTTLAIGGAATAVSLGAATGTLTIGNPTITGTNATALNLNGASPSIATTGGGTASVFNTSATTLNLGGAATAINMGITGGLTTITGSARITQNLTVVGTTTTTESETVLINDNHLYLNNGYSTPSGQTGGLVVNYLPIATTTTVAGAYVAGVAATSNPTVTTTGSGTFSAGQLIQIGGTVNPGLYEVLTHSGTTLTIKGIGVTATVEDFTQNQFTAAASDGATITRLNVGVMRVKADGSFWEVGSGSTTPVSFSNLATAAGATLQAAYDASSSPATITTNSTDDEVLITGTAGLRVTGTGADNTVSPGFGFEVDTTGAWRLLGDTDSTLSVDTGNLTISTVTSGTLAVNSGAALDMDAGTAGATLDSTGTISLDAAAASNFSTSVGDLTLASTAASAILTGGEAAADAVRLNASNAAGGIDADAGTAGVTIDTTGAFSIDGAAASNVSATGASLTISTITSGSLITTSAGLWDLNAGANLDIDVTGTYDMLSTSTFAIAGTGASTIGTTSGNLTLSTSTSGDISVNSVGGVTLDAQGATSFVTAMTGTDTSATSFRVQNNSAVTKFSVAGNGAITLGSADTDSVTVNAEFISSLVPDVDVTYNLGSATKRWDNLFVENLDSLSIGTTYVSGAAITANRVVYKNATADRVEHATNAAIATANTVIGVARTGAGAAGTNITVDYAGVVTMNSTGNIDVGDIVYLDTAGNVTETAPSASGSVVLVMGYAKTANGGSGTFLAHLAPRTPFEIP